LVSIVSFIFIFTAFSNIAAAQSNQLMLADILIALRSKKVTLPERNKILADAVVVRGITFALTPEIEKELTDTGADRTLIDSIRQKSHIVKTSAVVTPPVETKPKADPVPPPPDFGFYEKRADASLSKADFDAAITDYTKAIEMDPKSPEAYLGRGIAYSSKQSFDLAIADFDKAIELKPKNVAGYANRGGAFERKGDLDKASADYDKALEIEPANEFVKSGATRIKDAQAKALAAKKPEPVVAAPTTAAAPPRPEFVDLGGLTKTSATKMVTPVYPAFAVKSHIGGRVVVDVMLDEEGNVTSAKAGSGPAMLKSACEDAASRSKFKPAMYDNRPIKGKGFVIYNFTPE
ncbi:MAG TPA: TonB family protein, partial [Pyrinomonadaceae bacterium]|nr:TonB family protein [Pyrinomonadaceae bacterium]